MSEGPCSLRRLTVTVPSGLADFVDREASRLKVSRSRLVTDALRELQTAERERLAVEGYRFYAHEAVGFAQAGIGAVAEVLDRAD